MKKARHTLVGDRVFYRTLLAIVVPVIIQNGISNFVNLLDNLMVGALGDAQMSGVSIANQLVFVFNLTIFGGLAGPGIFGAHYFTLNDQAYLGRFDGENYQIGIVDVTQRPYEDFEEGIIETHREIYDIAEGKRPADAEPAEEIPAIFF